eukprot:6188073-Pleurochrysis_carterae.AAC.2
MQSAALAFEKRGNIGLDSVCSQYLVLLQSSPMRKDARRRGLDVLVMNGWETSKRQQDSSRSSKMPKIKVEKGYYAVESVAFAAPEASIAKSVQRYFAWSSPISRGYPSSASPRLPSASAAFSSATISASVGTAMACCGDSGDTAKESTSAASSRSCSSTACSVSLAGELMKGSLSPSLALLLLLSPIPEPPFAPTLVLGVLCTSAALANVLVILGVDAARQRPVDGAEDHLKVRVRLVRAALVKESQAVVKVARVDAPCVWVASRRARPACDERHCRVASVGIRRAPAVLAVDLDKPVSDEELLLMCVVLVAQQCDLFAPTSSISITPLL